MKYILLVYVCTSALILQSEALDSASELFLKPCKATNPLLQQCWLKKIEDLRLDLLRGIPDLRLPSIDALLIPRLTIGKRNSSAASYEAQYRDIVFTGARQFQILNINVDADALVFKLKIFLPTLHVETSYSVSDGMILGFQLHGDGSAEATCSNVTIDIVLDGEHYIKNGEEHIQWREGSVEIFYEDSKIQVYDLIKDPTELLLFNYFFNENLNTSLRPAMRSVLDRTVGNFIIEIINRVHEAFPKNSLYPVY